MNTEFTYLIFGIVVILIAVFFSTKMILSKISQRKDDDESLTKTDLKTLSDALKTDIAITLREPTSKMSEVITLLTKEGLDKEKLAKLR